MPLRHVFDMADAEGRRAFLEVSLAALPVYGRLGWRVIDKLAFSIDDEEVEEGRMKEERTLITWIMTREPVMKN